MEPLQDLPPFFGPQRSFLFDAGVDVADVFGKLDGRVELDDRTVTDVCPVLDDRTVEDDFRVLDE